MWPNIIRPQLVIGFGQAALIEKVDVFEQRDNSGQCRRHNFCEIVGPAEHFMSSRLGDRVRVLVSRIGGRQFSQRREGTRQVYVGGTVSLNSREDWIGRGPNHNVRQSCVGHFNLRWLLTPGGGIESKYRSNEITLALIRRPRPCY